MGARLKHISAAILAGGLGTRLRLVVADRPKVLADVCGRPFLAWLLDRLVNEGCSEIILCTGYLGDMVETTFGSSYRDCPLIYSREPSPLGTGGALRLAMPKFRNEHVLVLNGDSYCGADLAAFCDFHERLNADVSIVVAPVADCSRYGRVQTDAAGRVDAFCEKDSLDHSPGQINAGVYLIRRELIAELPTGQSVSLERDAFPAWTSRSFWAYVVDAEFLDIGTPESFRQAASLKLGRVANVRSKVEDEPTTLSPSISVGSEVDL